MRVQGGKGGGYGRIGNALMIDSIDVHLVHFLKDKIEFAPVVIPGIEKTSVLGDFLDSYDQHGTEHDSQDRYPN